MATPTQIAVIDSGNHYGAVPGTGSYTVRILSVGTAAGGIHTLSGADVAAGALVVPLVPVSRVVTAPVDLTVENLSEEPVITTQGDGTLSITIGSGLYAGSYTTRYDGMALSTAMIEAAPTCLLRPAVTGTPAVGQTLTIVPGLWIYDGPDPGDQTWLQALGGVPNGETDLDYVIKAEDVDKSFTVEETFGGVSVTSVPTPL